MGHQPNALAPYAAGHVLEGADPSGLNLDPNLLQTTIGSLLQSPAAAQMFLNSLNASVQGQSLSTPSKVPPSPPVSGPNVNDPTLALFNPLPPELVNNTNHLLGAYQKAAGVGGDVEKLQDSIDSLVRSMGLDLPAAGANGAAGNTGGYQQDTSLPSEGTFDESEFNVDELLDQLTNNNNNQEQQDV
jgi:heat shock transcription factor